MLRKDSNVDADFVAEFSRRHGVNVVVEAADVRAAAAEWKRGIEETARDIRYSFLARVARENQCDRIAVGHSLSDQAETVLMKLVRGSGLRGLAAMRPVSQLREHHSQNATDPLLLIRPLLCLSRTEIEVYCRERDLAYRIDQSNLTRDYARNRVRHDVLPLLASMNPQIERTLSRTADIAAADNEALDASARMSLEFAT